MDISQEKLLSIGIVLLLSVSGMAALTYYNSYDNDIDNILEAWIDPITEVENCLNCTGED